LATVYDAWNTGRHDSDFYVALAEELEATTILDVGCGTGQITCALAERGHVVTGVDPAGPMLDVARACPGGNLVRWIEGDASAYDGPPVDLAIMTAHVAQVIHDDDIWRSTLAATHRALQPRGALAFESRNPAVKGWRAWSASTGRRRLDASSGAAEVWFEFLELVRDEGGDIARCEIHYHFERTGEELVSTNVLRFRPREVLEQQLTEAGFTVGRVYGDWDRSVFTSESPEMIFLARA